MRELFDDFNDIEFDDNEIIDRLMREWEMDERRLAEAGHGKRSWKRSPWADEEVEDDYEDDLDDLDDYDEDYDDDYDDDDY